MKNAIHSLKQKVVKNPTDSGSNRQHQLALKLNDEHHEERGTLSDMCLYAAAQDVLIKHFGGDAYLRVTRIPNGSCSTGFWECHIRLNASLGALPLNTKLSDLRKPITPPCHRKKIVALSGTIALLMRDGLTEKEVIFFLVQQAAASGLIQFGLPGWLQLPPEPADVVATMIELRACWDRISLKALNMSMGHAHFPSEPVDNSREGIDDFLRFTH